MKNQEYYDYALETLFLKIIVLVLILGMFWAVYEIGFNSGANEILNHYRCYK